MTGEEFEQQEKEAQRNHVARVLESWGVPRRIRHNLNGLKQTTAIKAAAHWHSEPREVWSLVLCADKGLGKSTAAGWWLSKVAEQVRSSIGAPGRKGTRRAWLPATDLSAISFYGDDMTALCTQRALVLDDLGTEYADEKGSFATKLDRLFDARYREFRPIIITTNLSPKAMGERYTGRLLDRLREGSVWASFAGESMRGNG